jgi:membrane-associated protease RseP (regulator of RpoE activity)
MIGYKHQKLIELSIGPPKQEVIFIHNLANVVICHFYVLIIMLRMSTQPNSIKVELYVVVVVVHGHMILKVNKMF